MEVSVSLSGLSLDTGLSLAQLQDIVESVTPKLPEEKTQM